jgi:LysM repeat protein
MRKLETRHLASLGALFLILALAACRKQAAVPTPTQTSVAPTPTQAPQPTAMSTPVLPAPSPTPVIHVVQPGDSLSAIAYQYDVSMEALAQANGIADTNVIHVGQKLIIPGPTPIPTATVPPTMTPTPHIPPELEIVDVIGRGAPATETVVIANRGRSFSIEGWTLRDAQGNVYVFPKLYLDTGAEVRVHTGRGENTPLHLYWNRDTAVWQEAGDAAVVADDRGVIYASKPLD